MLFEILVIMIEGHSYSESIFELLVNTLKLGHLEKNTDGYEIPNIFLDCVFSATII